MFGKIAYQISFRVLYSRLKTLPPLTFHKTLAAFTLIISILPLSPFYIYGRAIGIKSPLLPQTLASPASSNESPLPCFHCTPSPAPNSVQSIAGVFTPLLRLLSRRHHHPSPASSVSPAPKPVPCFQSIAGHRKLPAAIHRRHRLG